MSARTDHRHRIVEAAADLLSNHGRAAVTTRAVSTAAGVQPPTIYRLFGDMTGLLDAVAADGFTRYLERKAALGASADPVRDLRGGWDLHVEFGLENPAHYLLMYGEPATSSRSGAAEEARRLLLRLMGRVAEAGRLLVGVEQAAQTLHAACMGVTLSLIGTAPSERDPALSSRTREAVLAAITCDATGEEDREPARRAVALRSVLDRAADGFSPGERLLLEEFLARLAASP
ncbi:MULTISPECIES: TetR/AcrR family transcriptional regulator [unclassified Nocardiopsis]|uniref:TetR/AcrR family transcriptional regulator n=1 Tax=unclassified Nocardiopsis TaxID=2649073 RepID=UPI00135CCFD3|nr:MULTISPECIES: TetR/AcrR family transcriptional regulator [unclassified Nocardiopsis]